MYAVGSTTCGRVPTAAADVSVRIRRVLLPAPLHHSRTDRRRTGTLRVAPSGLPENPAGVIRQAPDVRSVGQVRSGAGQRRARPIAGSDLESAVMARAAAKDSPARQGLW
jgi:hypothetical protein